MKFAVIFEDDPAADPEIRARNMQDHLAFLQAHESEIDAAGPLCAQEGSATGGLWLVTAGGRVRVQELVEADPFWPTGLRKSVTIREWRQVFAGGKPV